MRSSHHLRDFKEIFRRYLSDNVPNTASILASPHRDLWLADMMVSLPKIKYLLDNTYRFDTWEAVARVFLTERWARVVNGPLCYTVSPRYFINQMCIALANHLNEAAANSLLMPTILDEDVHMNELDELRFGQFIMADDNRAFIAIPSLVEQACSAIEDASPQIYLVAGADGRTRELSRFERLRLHDVYGELESMRAFLEGARGVDPDNLYQRLLRLRNGLLRGDVAHGGREQEAGADAYQAVAEFREFYFERLTEAQRATIRGVRVAGQSLGDVFDIIFRGVVHGHLDGNYCMEIRGRDLQRIITANQERLSGMCVSRRLLFRQRRARLLSRLEQPNAFEMLSAAGLYPVRRLRVEQLLTIFSDMLPSIDTELRNLFEALGRFVLQEYCLALGKYRDPKLAYWFDLLMAICLESVTLPDALAQRPERLATAFVVDIHNRISMLINHDPKVAFMNFGSGARYTRLRTAFPLLRRVTRDVVIPDDEARRFFDEASGFPRRELATTEKRHFLLSHVTRLSALARANRRDGLIRFGWFHALGHQVALNYLQAAKLFQKAFQVGAEQALVSKLLSRLRDYRPEGVNGMTHAACLVRIGRLLKVGNAADNLEANPDEAIKFFKAATELGSGEAWLLLGHCHKEGLGALVVDYRKAAICYVRSLERGYFEAVVRRSLAAIREERPAALTIAQHADSLRDIHGVLSRRQAATPLQRQEAALFQQAARHLITDRDNARCKRLLHKLAWVQIACLGLSIGFVGFDYGVFEQKNAIASTAVGTVIGSLTSYGSHRFYRNILAQQLGSCFNKHMVLSIIASLLLLYVTKQNTENLTVLVFAPLLYLASMFGIPPIPKALSPIY